MDEDGNISLGAELIRKGIHLFALVIPIGHSLVPPVVGLPILVFCALFSILIDISRLKDWFLWRLLRPILSPIIRPHEIKGQFTGASFILSTSVLSIILFPWSIAIAAIVFIIVGDTAAAIIGRAWGKHKLIRSKTLEGSTACLTITVLASFLIPGLPTSIGLAGAVAATITELVTFRLDDNFTVQMVSGFVMLGLMALMGYDGAQLFTVFRAF